MGKYGKLFRRLQIEEWKDNYINYKLLKQKIRRIKHNVFSELDKIDIHSSNLIPLIPKDDEDMDLNTLYKDKFGEYLKEFIELLDKEFRKSYIFFVNMEKELYQKINTHLYIQSNYNNFNINDIYSEIKSIRLTSYFAKCLNCFIHDNMIALKKILKKFDKKFSIVFGIITTKYILSHLQIQNSDLEYYLQFKLIDEGNVICENNSNLLYDLFYNKLKENKDLNIGNLSENFLESYNDIKSYLKDIDDITYFKIQYKEWFYYIKKGNKIMKNNLTLLDNDISNPLLSSSYKKDSIVQKFLSSNNASKDIKRKQMILTSKNKKNICLIFVQEFFYMLLYSSSILPIYLILNEILDDNYTGLFISITPFFSTFSVLFFNNLNYLKCSMILSYILFLLGSLMFIFVESDIFSKKKIYLLIISRILIGLGAPGKMGRKYITIYVSKYYLPNISFKYLTVKYLGFGFGPLLNLLSYYYLPEFSFSIKTLKIEFNDKTFIGFFGCLFSFFLIILNSILLTKPHSKKFSMVKTKNKYKKVNDDEKNDNQNLSYSSNNIDKGTDNSPLISDEEKKIINEMENKLNAFNEKNNFTNINLIPSNLEIILEKEKKEFRYVNKNLLIIFTLFFFSKFLYGNCLSFIPEYFESERRENKKDTTLYLFISLLIESIANFFINPFNNRTHLFRNLLLQLIFISLIFSSGFIFLDNPYIYLVSIAILMLITRFIEIICSLMLSNINPPLWTWCNFKTGKFPLVLISLGESFGCFSVSLFKESNRYFIFGCTVSIYGFLFIIILIYKDFRINAITRILRKKDLEFLGV